MGNKVRKRAVCFRCKKKFTARKEQHPRYSLCPVCKNYKEELGSGYSWIEYRYKGPK